MECRRRKSASRFLAYQVAKLLAVVFAVDLDKAAHFEQTGAHALADAITERVIGRDSLGCRHACLSWRAVEEIAGDDRGQGIVVPRVEDDADCVPNPLGRLYRSDVVDQNNFGLENRAQNLQLCRLDGGVVAILDLLEQLTVIAKKATHSFFNELLHGRD